jgi:hypothetical protein
VKPVDGGFCFGLLDPVSNILVSQAIALHKHKLPEGEKEEVRVPTMPQSIYQRSRHGLVALVNRYYKIA